MKNKSKAKRDADRRSTFFNEGRRYAKGLISYYRDNNAFRKGLQAGRLELMNGDSND